MLKICMRHASNNCDLIHHFTDGRKMLTDLCSGDLCGYGSELAPYFAGSIRLQIVGVLLALPTKTEDNDA